MTGIKNLLKYCLVGVITIYQYTTSCFITPCCRFYPSCSQYAISAIKKHGILKGLILTSCRLLRCNPFNLGGVDLVPDKISPYHWRR
ncbi:MAG: membrane protein insertion efficiency factor YidD [Endozoicomonadaceae bacterium]|nr:membrane protein insertion efficiency factor YidD [Endozoicomonadaceae bacterium]